MDKMFKMARPAIAEQLQDIEGKEAKKIEPEIAAAVDIMPDAVRSRMLKMLTGSEEIQPQIVEGKDGNIETVYPLTKPSERSKYNTFKDYLNYAGFARIISDYAKIFGVEGTSTAKLGWGPLARIAGFGSAAITPLKIANAEKTALYNTIAQTEEGRTGASRHPHRRGPHHRQRARGAALCGRGDLLRPWAHLRRVAQTG